MKTTVYYVGELLTSMGCFTGELMGSCKVDKYTASSASPIFLIVHFGVRWVKASLGNLAQYLHEKIKNIFVNKEHENCISLGNFSCNSLLPRKFLYQSVRKWCGFFFHLLTNAIADVMVTLGAPSSFFGM